MDETVFHTQTMAKVLFDQGNLDQAADIYRYLLEKDPDRKDLEARLRDIEIQLQAGSSERIIGLFQEWFHWVFAYKRIRQLQKLNTRRRDLKEKGSNLK